MLRFICVCFLVLTLGLDYLQDQTLTAHPDREQELVELSQRRFQAFFDGDKAAYERLLASEVEFVYSNGRVLDRGQAIAESKYRVCVNYGGSRASCDCRTTSSLECTQSRSKGFKSLP